ncbi:MAG: hypothetical protein WA982_07245, partial [Rubrobacteraceae bacterium]
MKNLWQILLLTLLLTGCGGAQQDTGKTSPPSTPEAQAVPETTIQTPATTISTPETNREAPDSTMGESREDNARPGQRPEPQYGYTYGAASGNHAVEGTGRLPESEPVDVRLDGVPTWVVGVTLGDNTAWVVALDDGRVQAFRLNGSGPAEPISISKDQLAPGQPPLVKSEGGSLELVTSRNAAASELTHPVPVSPDGGKEQLGVGADTQVFEEISKSDSVGIGATGIAALPDARFVRGAGGTLAFLSDPTERYDHGVLGDAIEADSLTLLRPGEEENLEAGTIFPESGGVFEQISPLWFGVPGADGDLLAVTESTPELATRVSVYGLDGSLVAAGPYIGEPSKWRHLIS